MCSTSLNALLADATIRVRSRRAFAAQAVDSAHALSRPESGAYDTVPTWSASAATRQRAAPS